MASKRTREIINRFREAFTGDFDMDQLLWWLGILRTYFRREYPDDQLIDKAVRTFLSARFNHIVKTVKSRHKLEVAGFGPEEIGNKFRPYLTERIRASVELIKLNRDQEIEAQLRRFAGWASGGMEGQDKRGEDLHKSLNQSIRQMTYVRRRVTIDQGHKLMAAIDDTIAKEYGAIARKWRHIIPHPDYQSRKEHLYRNNKVYAVKDNPELKAGRMKRGPNGYAEDLPDQPAELPYCSCWWSNIYSVEDLPPEMRTNAK